ncbi:MAG: ABC transporter ATP-binding protein [Chloroflexota bacterium]|nr:ABC transporter ATP-binding protein [Chloroflexota bacterium]
MEPIEKLQLKGVTRRFGATTALDRFTLEIAGGTFVTLLGPSGCGKTTALNCLAGLLELSEGEIILNARPIQQLPAERRGFGMVFQNYALFPHLTVFRNVSYGLEIRRVPRSERERRVRRALALVHLDAFEKRYPAQLSGGQQQRLALARTVVLEPSLLLLDEPLSNLDTNLRNEMRIEIKRLHDQLNLTTLYVTHDQAEAMSLSDLVVVMRQGYIEQKGPPQEIYTRPRSLYVASFMGYNNRLPVEIVGREDHYFVVQTASGVKLRATSTVEGSEGWQHGNSVLACFRPDETQADLEAPLNTLRGRVQLVEYMGKSFESLVHLEGAEETQLLVQSQRAPESGTLLDFSVHPDRFLLFPADNQGQPGVVDSAAATEPVLEGRG